MFSALATEIRHKSAQCIKEIEQEIRSQIRAKRGQNDRPVLMEHKGLNQLRQELLNQERIRESRVSMKVLKLFSSA